jgi:nitrate reductase gamma subunit
MKLAQQRDVFLSVTLIAVVVAGVVALIGWDQYETDRDNHRGMFITNEHVTNLHHELVKGE